MTTTLRASVIAVALIAVVAGCGGTTESATLGTITETEAPSLAPTAASASASASTSSAFDLVEYPVTAGSHPHDVAPAADGGVWYTSTRRPGRSASSTSARVRRRTA